MIEERLFFLFFHNRDVICYTGHCFAQSCGISIKMNKGLSYGPECSLGLMARLAGGGCIGQR